MVRLVSAPVRVLETDQVKISEYFGGASCSPCPFPVGDVRARRTTHLLGPTNCVQTALTCHCWPQISVAHVQVEAGWAEEWQTPAFDEYALVLVGSVTIETTRGPATKVSAGQANPHPHPNPHPNPNPNPNPNQVSAGQAVFLAKGERVRWHFTERAECVPHSSSSSLLCCTL